MKKNGKANGGEHTELVTQQAEPQYSSEYAEQAYKYSVLNAPDALLASFLGLPDIKVLEAWRQRYPDFAQAIREGREVADASVSLSLLKRAQGYNIPYRKVYRHADITQVDVETGEKAHPIKAIEEGMNHVPASMEAIKMWMHTRRPELWPVDMRPKGPVDPSGKPIEMEEDLVELIVARVTSRRTRKLTASSPPDPADEPDA